MPPTLPGPLLLKAWAAQAGSEKKVPITRKDVSFPLRMVEVVRGAPDDDNGFLFPSHASIWNLLDLLSIISVKHVIFGGGVFCYHQLLSESFFSAGE